MDSQRSIIEYSETARSRRFRADINNEAVKNLSQPLAEIIASRLPHQGNYGNRQIIDPSAVIMDGSITQPGNDAEQAYQNASQQVEGKSVALPLRSDLEVLQRIFRRTADSKWRVNDSRLGQTSKIDFAKRLASLFLLLRQFEGQESVPRGELTEVLSDANVDDGNTRHWLSNNDLIRTDGVLVTLLLPGREFAHKVLREYLDPNTETNWSLESKSRRRSSKSHTGEKEEVPEGGSKTSKSNRAIGTSYRAQVNKLVETDFFSEDCTALEVKAELERLGHKFQLGRINNALLSLTQRKKLTRYHVMHPETWTRM